MKLNTALQVMLQVATTLLTVINQTSVYPTFLRKKVDTPEKPSRLH